MTLAPIALFVYRRPGAVDAVLDALEACAGFADSPVFVFSDGPRDAAAEQQVAAVRAAVKARLRSNMTLVERPANLGLAASIIAGTTDLCARFGRVIVIEDDHLVAPLALAWFNAGLDSYADDPTVMQVSGFAFDVPQITRRGRGVFLYHSVSWGWATWQRAWSQFDPDCPGWERSLATRSARHHFNLRGTGPYVDMLRSQMAGRIDSWAVRWLWTVINARGIVLHPPQTMVTNVGLTAGDGTHGQRTAGLLPIGKPWDADTLPHMPPAATLDEWAVAAYVRRMRWSRHGVVVRLASWWHWVRKHRWHVGR